MAKTKVYIEFDRVSVRHYVIPVIVVHSGVVPTAQDIEHTWNRVTSFDIGDNATMQGDTETTDQLKASYIPELNKRPI